MWWRYGKTELRSRTLGKHDEIHGIYTTTNLTLQFTPYITGHVISTPHPLLLFRDKFMKNETTHLSRRRKKRNEKRKKEETRKKKKTRILRIDGYIDDPTDRQRFFIQPPTHQATHPRSQPARTRPCQTQRLQKTPARRKPFHSCLCQSPFRFQLA